MVEKKEIVICKCDACKKEVKSETDLIKIHLPCRRWSLNSFYYYDKTDTYDEMGMEVCKDCFTKILAQLEEILNYGFYDYDGYEVSLKENDENEDKE